MGRNLLICRALSRLIAPAFSKTSTWSIIHCAWMARYSWAATSSDTVDGSDRSAKKSLRFSTHSVSWKGSTGVVPFQAFLQLSTVPLYSFFAPKECGMMGLREANVNQVRRVAPEPVPKRYLLATRAPSRRGAYRRVGLAVGSRPRS